MVFGFMIPHVLSLSSITVHLTVGNESELSQIARSVTTAPNDDDWKYFSWAALTSIPTPSPGPSPGPPTPSPGPSPGPRAGGELSGTHHVIVLGEHTITSGLRMCAAL